MKKWIKVKKGWLLQPLKTGIDFITLENNVAIEFLNPKQKEKMISILLGLSEVPKNSENKSISSTVEYLFSKDIISISTKKPRYHNLSAVENRIWQLRKKFVGKNCYISTVYWLDPKNSQFTPHKMYLFNAKYNISIGKNRMLSQWASGISDNKYLAQLKTIMEGLERYSSSVVSEKDLHRTTAAKLGTSAINPSKVVRYAKNQYKKGFPFFPFSKSKEYYWKEVYSLKSGKKLYLPVECLVYPIDPLLSPNIYTYANSSGVASGFSFQDTLLRALYEVIERDAFMITWINRLTMPKISHSSLPKDIKKRIKDIEKKGYTIHLIDITLDIANVVLAVVFKLNPAILIIGSACNMSKLKAVYKALNEIEMGLYWETKEKTKKLVPISPEKVKNTLDHVKLYRSLEYLQKASFLWQGLFVNLNLSRLKISNELDALVKLFQEKQREILVSNLTTPDLKKAGVYVLRAISPGLVPISFGYQMEPMGMERITDVARDLRIPTNPWNNNKPLPHPFP